MAFSDVMQSLGRFIGLYSDTDANEDLQAYDTYQQPDDLYVPTEEETSYESGYGAGGSYVRAGAKPTSAKRPSEEPASSLFRGRPQKQPQQQPYYPPDNVIRMPERDDRGGDVQVPTVQALQSSTIIFCVRRKDDSSDIINYLIQGINVILNFEEIDDAQCQRVLDMVSGAAFALRGSVERISHRNYLVAPTGVQIVRSEQQAREPHDARDGGYAREGGYARDRGYAARY